MDTKKLVLCQEGLSARCQRWLAFLDNSLKQQTKTVWLSRAEMKRGSTVALISRTHLETELVAHIFYADTLKVCEAPRISSTVHGFEAASSKTSSFYILQVIVVALYYDEA